MKQKIFPANFNSGNVEFAFCEKEGRRWVELPNNVKLVDDGDVEEVSEIMANAYSFLVGDMELEELR